MRTLHTTHPVHHKSPLGSRDRICDTGTAYQRKNMLAAGIHTRSVSPWLRLYEASTTVSGSGIGQ